MFRKCQRVHEVALTNKCSSFSLHFSPLYSCLVRKRARLHFSFIKYTFVSPVNLLVFKKFEESQVNTSFLKKVQEVQVLAVMEGENHL